MKKALLALSLILIFGLMFYLTKPNNKDFIVSSYNHSDTTASASITSPPVNSIKPVTIDTASCDTDELFAALDQLKQQRNDSIKALISADLEAKQLSDMVKTHLRDHQLSQEIYTQELPVIANTTPDQESLNLFRNQREKIEDLMMSAWAGQSDESIDQFLKGELAPLNPDSKLHKHFLINLIAMSGEKQTLDAINKLFTEDGPLDPEVAPAIITAVDDPKSLKQFLGRVTDINKPVSNNGFFMNSNRTKPLLQTAMNNKKVAAAEILLELGVKPSTDNNRISFNYFFRNNPDGIGLLNKLLDRGYQPMNASSAENFAHQLQEQHPDLAARVTAIGAQMKQQQANNFANLPQDFKEIIDEFKAQHVPLNKQYLECIANNSSRKPAIPPYQPIDTAKIEADIDQMVMQKIQYEQIIASLAAINKETVEHGYRYLRRLRNTQNVSRSDMQSMTQEVRTLIGMMRKEQWTEMVEFLQKSPIDANWEITPATMVGAMIDKNAPESAIIQMVRISDKSDVKLLNQSLQKPELLKRLAGYGFNLNATGVSNKNLFYQVVRRNMESHIDFLVAQGVALTSDPYGYDALDMLLRKSYVSENLYKKLNAIGFPLTEHHLDYTLYLKTYYPQRYEKIIAAWPDLEVEGEWKPKS
ncbi:hypothetical protein [Kangiella sp. HZ709]|uniref:hypothetical protein n=1 Tax=Kangiella sp. HZ709 TaxID=2666328 RepID=UPI0012AEE99D|nr:hypothetical protein [Kangiella sp. HZ709]MRX27830.1 hypothetical protein [Kangiella sp. HZ709]